MKTNKIHNTRKTIYYVLYSILLYSSVKDWTNERSIRLMLTQTNHLKIFSDTQIKWELDCMNSVRFQRNLNFSFICVYNPFFRCCFLFYFRPKINKNLLPFYTMLCIFFTSFQKKLGVLTDDELDTHLLYNNTPSQPCQKRNDIFCFLSFILQDIWLGFCVLFIRVLGNKII